MKRNHSTNKGHVCSWKPKRSVAENLFQLTVVTHSWKCPSLGKTHPFCLMMKIQRFLQSWKSLENYLWTSFWAAAMISNMPLVSGLAKVQTHPLQKTLWISSDGNVVAISNLRLVGKRILPLLLSWFVVCSVFVCIRCILKLYTLLAHIYILSTYCP